VCNKQKGIRPDAVKSKPHRPISTPATIELFRFAAVKRNGTAHKIKVAEAKHAVPNNINRQ